MDQNEALSCAPSTKEFVAKFVDQNTLDELKLNSYRFDSTPYPIEVAQGFLGEFVTKNFGGWGHITEDFISGTGKLSKEDNKIALDKLHKGKHPRGFLDSNIYMWFKAETIFEDDQETSHVVIKALETQDCELAKERFGLEKKGKPVGDNAVLDKRIVIFLSPERMDEYKKFMAGNTAK